MSTTSESVPLSNQAGNVVSSSALTEAAQRDTRKKRKAKKEEVQTVVEKGLGVFTFPNSASYDGEWQKFGDVMKRHGKGKYTGPPTQQGQQLWYEGEWREDCISGHGTFHYCDGSVYNGDWLNGKYEGQGKYIFPNGTYYEGQFSDNKMNGKGIFVDQTGQAWTGMFFNNSGPGLTIPDD